MFLIVEILSYYIILPYSSNIELSKSRPNINCYYLLHAIPYCFTKGNIILFYLWDKFFWSCQNIELISKYGESSTYFGINKNSSFSRLVYILELVMLGNYICLQMYTICRTVQVMHIFFGNIDDWLLCQNPIFL